MIFSSGPFWDLEAVFGVLKGVVSTHALYIGGMAEDPTFERIGDHSEAVRVDFFSSLIDFSSLLDVFFASHDPYSLTLDRRYASTIFYFMPHHLAQASERIERMNKDHPGVQTSIYPVTASYSAETHNQKHYLFQSRLLSAEFHEIYKTRENIINSTAAARVNGILGGAWSESLYDEISLCGLSPESEKYLKERLSDNMNKEKAQNHEIY